MVAIVGVGLGLSIPLLSFEMERMGVSNALIGLNTAVAGLASIVTIPFVPRLAGRLGVGPLILASIATVTLSFLAFKLMPSFTLWFPLRFIFSAGLGALFVLSEFWITAAAPPDRRGLVMGVYATALAVAFAAGPAILVLVGTSGWPVYLIGTAMFALASLPLVAARRLTPTLKGTPHHSIMSFIAAAPAATLAAAIYGAAETGGFSLLPIYGLRLGFTSEQAAWLVSLLILGNVAFQIPVGLLSDRVDRRVVLLAAGAAGALGAAFIPFAAAQPLALKILLFIWGGAIGGLYTVGLAHLGARFAGGDLASANAAFVILYNVGLLLGPPAIGLGMDAADPHGFAGVLAGLFLVYVIVAALSLRHGSQPVPVRRTMRRKP